MSSSISRAIADLDALVKKLEDGALTVAGGIEKPLSVDNAGDETVKNASKKKKNQKKDKASVVKAKKVSKEPGDPIQKAFLVVRFIWM